MAEGKGRGKGKPAAGRAKPGPKKSPAPKRARAPRRAPPTRKKAEKAPPAISEEPKADEIIIAPSEAIPEPSMDAGLGNEDGDPTPEDLRPENPAGQEPSPPEEEAPAPEAPIAPEPERQEDTPPSETPTDAPLTPETQAGPERQEDTPPAETPPETSPAPEETPVPETQAGPEAQGDGPFASVPYGPAAQAPVLIREELPPPGSERVPDRRRLVFAALLVATAALALAVFSGALPLSVAGGYVTVAYPAAQAGQAQYAPGAPYGMLMLDQGSSFAVNSFPDGYRGFEFGIPEGVSRAYVTGEVGSNATVLMVLMNQSDLDGFARTGRVSYASLDTQEMGANSTIYIRMRRPGEYYLLFLNPYNTTGTYANVTALSPLEVTYSPYRMSPDAP